ncbi:hypothetical protein [Candidatus Vondammii sp. HM_W22]|uniref:hypothetical protein n=1 Tax=Candidatus Vondammii sp. HM_W22 TaxID=2687299 RepID=UPI001F1493B1|nr:hypothetical protein [Candidatus Vondammii sp. HM_W22]
MTRINVADSSARKGQIVDAAIAPAPRQRNRREENRQIKAGDSPEAWSDNKRRQKDVEARWIMKHGKTHYGYKKTTGIDRKNFKKSLNKQILVFLEFALK